MGNDEDMDSTPLHGDALVSRKTAALAVLASLSMQATAIAIFPVVLPDAVGSIPEYLLILSVAALITPISIGLRFGRHHLAAEVLFWFRALMTMVVGIPLSADRWPEFLLVLSLVFEATFFHGMLAGTCISLALISLDLLLQGSHRAWGKVIPPVPAGILLANLILYAFMFAGIRLIKVTLERARKAEADRERLAGTVERLTGAGEDFLSYARSAEYRSAKDERNRLTREVHDVVGYTLTNIRMMMEASLRRKDMDRAELERLFSWTLDQAQRGLQEIRSILQLIRSGGTPEARGIAALAEAGSVFQAATGTRVSFDWGNMSDRWIAGDRDLLALRLVQEGMINAVRHGMARNVEISLFQDEAAAYITVQDDGTGMDAVKKGIGLSGMEERVRAIGGSLAFSQVRPGFRISAVLPFQGDEIPESVSATPIAQAEASR